MSENFLCMLTLFDQEVRNVACEGGQFLWVDRPNHGPWGGALAHLLVHAAQTHTVMDVDVK